MIFIHNSKLRTMILTTFALPLVACSGLSAIDQNPVNTPAPLTFLHDELFLTSTQNITEPDYLFSLPDAYKRDLEADVLPLETEYARYRALREWVFRNFEDYEFDSTETYSLGELNTNRKINCLSFSAIFVAAARYVNVPASFQLVSAPPYWDSENGTWINNQHIDVTGSLRRTSDDNIKSLPARPFTYRYYKESTKNEENNSSVGLRNTRYVIDINPAIVSMPLERQIIDDQQVLSLYYNNKSIESLLKQDLPLAYAYTKEALLTDPISSAAWNNLGVLYSRIDQLQYATNAFKMAIEIDEKAYSAKSNLANVYQRQGETFLAEELAASVEEFRSNNPYYHQSLADTSVSEGDYSQAIEHLEDAVSRKYNEPYFYHALAIAYQKIGNDAEVIENLTNARRHSTGAERARFSGKLKALQELVEAREAQ